MPDGIRRAAADGPVEPGHDENRAAVMLMDRAQAMRPGREKAMGLRLRTNGRRDNPMAK